MVEISSSTSGQIAEVNVDFNDIVKKAADQGIPVLDLINGMSSPQIAARAAVSFWDMGHEAGSYLRRLQDRNGKPMKTRGMATPAVRPRQSWSSPCSAAMPMILPASWAQPSPLKLR